MINNERGRKQKERKYRPFKDKLFYIVYSSLSDFYFAFVTSNTWKTDWIQDSLLLMFL